MAKQVKITKKRLNNLKDEAELWRREAELLKNKIIEMSEAVSFLSKSAFEQAFFDGRHEPGESIMKNIKGIYQLAESWRGHYVN